MQYIDRIHSNDYTKQCRKDVRHAIDGMDQFVIPIARLSVDTAMDNSKLRAVSVLRVVK